MSTALVLVSLAVPASLASPVAALTAEHPMSVTSEDWVQPQTLEDLTRIYNVGKVRADVLVAIDTSKSMFDDKHWPKVQEGMKALAAALSPSDKLGIVTFDEVGGSLFRFESVQDPAKRQEALGQLPAGIRREEFGSATDIGAGLKAAIDQMDAGDSPVQTLIFITDGKHNPPAGSPFSGRPGEGETKAWKALQKAGKEMRDGHGDALSVYSYGIGESRANDARLVNEVIPGTQFMDIPSSQIKTMMEEVAVNAQRARVRPEVRKDLRTPIKAKITVPGELAEDMPGTLTLTNPRVGLETVAKVESLTVTDTVPDGPPVAVEMAPQELVLAPGQSKDVPLVLHPAGTDHGHPIGKDIDSRTWDASLRATTQVAQETADLLKLQDLAPPPPTTGEVALEDAQIEASTTYGISRTEILLAILALLLIICLIALGLWWWFVPAALHGVITNLKGEHLMTLSGRTPQPLPAGLVRSPGTGADKVELFTKAHKGHRVWVRKMGGEPEWNGELLGKGKALSGMDEISLGDLTVCYYNEAPDAATNAGSSVAATEG